MTIGNPMTKEHRDALRSECLTLTEDGMDGNPSMIKASELLWLLDELERLDEYDDADPVPHKTGDWKCFCGDSRWPHPEVSGRCGECGGM